MTGDTLDMKKVRSRSTQTGRAFRALAAAALAVLLPLLPSGCDSGRPRGEIRVTSNPSGGNVSVNGVRHDVTPTTVQKVGPGLHLVDVEKEGYRPARRSVTLVEGTVAVDFKLEPVQGLVLMQSTPTGADVTIDGAFRGKTPLLVTDIPLGDHRARFAVSGFLPKEVAFNIVDRNPQKIEVDLSSDSGTISVRSEPAGADVLLNGQPRGKTPCELESVPSGQADVEVRLEGYEAFREQVTLAAQETKVVMARLKSLPVELQVITIPEGARIYVDNQFRGASPITLTDLAPGPHRLRAELSGYELAARDVTLTQSKRVVEEFRLSKNSGKIILVSEPSGVKVFLNGQEKGVTQPPEGAPVSENFEIDLLPPGDYVLTLQRKGYRHAPKAIKLAPNAVATLHEKMARLFIPDIRVRFGKNGDLIREGMLIKQYPNGDVELQINESGTIMKISGNEIVSKQPITSP